jgi:hypothetical protein
VRLFQVRHQPLGDDGRPDIERLDGRVPRGEDLPVPRQFLLAHPVPTQCR